MEIVDSHVHLYPLAVSRDPTGWASTHQESLWSQLCTRRRKDGSAVQAFPTMAQLLYDMNEAGIRHAVLQGWYWENHASCLEHNKFYASCIQAYPSRFSAFATVHPAAGEAALDEVRRAKASGFSGLGELSPHAQKVPLDDPIWRKILKLAGDLRMPVNLHVTDPNSVAFSGRVETPLADFIALAKDFPQTNFILAHWGGGLAWSQEALGLPNVWYDTAASPLLYSAEVWKNAPLGRVLFGSDYPLNLYPKLGPGHGFTGLVNEAKNAGAEESIFRVNAATLLGWEE